MFRTLLTIVTFIFPTFAFAQSPDDASAADNLWEGRVDGAKLEQALAAYETSLAASPNDRHALSRLVRGWYFYGDAFTDDADTKIERWQKAIGFGNRCLAINADFSAKVKSGEKEREAASTLQKDDVPCMYWTSTALGKWAKIQGITTTLKHVPTVKAYMSRVDELDPSYFNYGPARYWGAYYAALPGFAGKDLEKSKTYLAASIEGAPNYLGTRVIRADFLAPQQKDLAGFDADLKFVLEADPNALPEIAPENTKEQEKAKKLIGKRGDLFVDAEGK